MQIFPYLRYMKTTNTIWLSFLCDTILDTSTDACVSSILYDNHTYNEGNRSVITGIPLWCHEIGQYGVLCNDGTVQPSSANLVCAEYGFPGQFQDMSFQSIIDSLTLSCLFVAN